MMVEDIAIALHVSGSTVSRRFAKTEKMLKEAEKRISKKKGIVAM